MPAFNVWAVFAATLTANILGAIWCSPKVYGDRWLQVLGKTGEQLGGSAKTLALTLVAWLITAAIIEFLFNSAGLSASLPAYYGCYPG